MPPDVRRADRRSGAPVRLGLVGLGAVARLVYVPLLTRRTDLFELAAVCDLVPSVAEEVGARLRLPPERRHATLDALLGAGQVEAVALLTSGSHGADAKAVLAAGLPLLCEKPLAYTLAEVDALPRGCLQLGYMKLHDPAVVQARRLLAERGPLRSVEVLVLHPSMARQLRHLPPPPAPPAPDEPLRAALDGRTAALRRAALGPAADELGALYTDVLLGSVVHDLALVRAFAGDPLHVDHVEVWPGGRWPPSVEVAASLPGDARLAVRWHYLEQHPAYREEVRLHTDDGSLTLEFPTPYLLHAPTTLTATAGWQTGAQAVAYASATEAFEQQLVAFHGLVVGADGLSSPVAGVAEGRADIVTAQRIVRRLADRRGVPISGEAAPP